MDSEVPFDAEIDPVGKSMLFTLLDDFECLALCDERLRTVADGVWMDAVPERMIKSSSDAPEEGRDGEAGLEVLVIGCSDPEGVASG